MLVIREPEPEAAADGKVLSRRINPSKDRFPLHKQTDRLGDRKFGAQTDRPCECGPGLAADGEAGVSGYVDRSRREVDEADTDEEVGGEGFLRRGEGSLI